MTLWWLLEQSWPLAWPRPRLRGAIGDDALAALERAGVVRTSPLVAGDAYPCRSPVDVGCSMRVVDEGGLVAICGHLPSQCHDERLEGDDASRCHVDRTSLTTALQRAARLPVRPARGRHGAFALGVRRVGDVDARFVWVPRPTRWLDDGWLDRSVDEDPDPVLVALVFDAIPADAPRRVRGTRVEWVALSAAFDVATATLDLARLWLAVAPGADLAGELWPRYAFTVDAERGRVTYAGRPLDLERRPIEARLLVEILRRAGDWVPRRDLLLALWPEEFSSRTRQPIDPVALDRRLRQLKSALSAVFAELPAIAGVPVDPIENLRTRGDTDGGYRVAVAPDRVWWRAGVR